MSEKKVGVCGKVLHSQAREIVANVINFMKQEATNGNPVIPFENFKKRVLAATGIGEFSYRKVQKESQEIAASSNSKFRSPRKNINRPKPKSNLSEGETETIRSIIHNYCILEKKTTDCKR